MAGAFDINPERGKDFGIQLGVAPERCYPDYKTMLMEEAKRSPEDRIEAVTIAVPNGLHYAVCKAVLEAGFHAVCEKPLCFTTEQAEELVHLADSKGLVVGVTYGYSGHQLIEQARQMVLHGDLGEIRLIKMQFPFGAYNTAVEETNAAARWRMDPAKAGPSFVLGDVGTHPLFLAETMVPDFEIENLMCTTKSFIPTRKLEDNAFVIMNLKGGAQATCWASAINCGALHGQKVRIVGSKASVEWYDERPNQLTYEIEGEPVRILERGGAYLYPSARAEDRISGGHTEGLFDAWSNLTAVLPSPWRRPIKVRRLTSGIRMSMLVPKASSGSRSAWNRPRRVLSGSNTDKSAISPTKRTAHSSGFLCMPSYLAICLAVVARRHASDFVEGLVEIAGAVVARADGDLRDGQCRVDE